MKNILIICPSAPPNNSPDNQRIRVSIPYFKEKGWESHILATDPFETETPIDDFLANQPDICSTTRINPLPSKYTRKIGLGNLGYRSLLATYRTGNKLIKKMPFDLIYFSTTAFPIMLLARIWWKKYKIPCILDIQDPWRNDFYLSLPRAKRPPKYAIAHKLDSMLEKWTIPHVQGIISVSNKYYPTLVNRYSIKIPNETIPFASSPKDFDLVKSAKIKNPIFSKNNDTIHFIYTGAITPGMPDPLKFMLVYFKKVLDENKFKKRIKLFFIGTSYVENSKSILMPIVKRLGMEDIVFEQIKRISYFESIKVMLDTDAILLPGSMEPGYTASKIYPYILSEKPIIALTHRESSVSTILKSCNTGPVINFTNEQDLASKGFTLCKAINKVLHDLPYKSNINWPNYNNYSVETMVEKQLNFFKEIISNG